MQQPFPSLVIRADALVPQGSFAEAQAEFLAPDSQAVSELDRALSEQGVGVVAHYYMDPELQGTLSACSWPHIAISDSLVMADNAIKMAEAGLQCVVVLGVDFMSENVRAMLDASGHQDVVVYRVQAAAIGCSLAESAERAAYGAYLSQAQNEKASLHVVYINTSLEVKARAHHMVPTITCTSSNVVKTVLQATAQVPDLHVFFGPDTYMGRNLRELFEGLLQLPEEQIAALHPDHSRETVTRMLERFNYFQQGTCVVHHMFGAEVVKVVEKSYQDAYVTAHLEVPGEMFALALAAQKNNGGVVGSTSNILAFIEKKVSAQIESGSAAKLRFVLGTEAGMITSIVRSLQGMLASSGVAGLEAEIIFPVASEAVAASDDSELAVVPGVAGGEGCSTAGGCATCPYMKMNSLDALSDLLVRLATAEAQSLTPMYPRKYTETIGERSAADLGGEPILHMRHFQKTGSLSAELVADIQSRNSQAG